MKISIGNLLHVEVDSTAVIDEIERKINTTMTGCNQVLVSIEELDEVIEANKCEPILSEDTLKVINTIIERARLLNCRGDVIIYC